MRLADLRARLRGIPRNELDQTLLALQREGALVLYRIDDPTDIRAEDEAAALLVAGFPRHIVYATGSAHAPGKRVRRPRATVPTELAWHGQGTREEARLKPSLAKFAGIVQRAATSSPKVVRWHHDRAFISSVYSAVRDKLGGMTLDQFKEKLVEAHRAQLLRLSRADLVSAMDPDLVRRSETRYLSASFHFVGVDPDKEQGKPTLKKETYLGTSIWRDVKSTGGRFRVYFVTPEEGPTFVGDRKTLGGAQTLAQSQAKRVGHRAIYGWFKVAHDRWTTAAPSQLGGSKDAYFEIRT